MTCSPFVLKGIIGAMSEILFSINGMNVTLGVLVAVLSGLAVLLLIGLLLVQGRQSRVRGLEAQEQSLRVEELQQQLFELLKAQSATTGQVQFLAQGFGSKQEELNRTVNERLDAVTHRIGENMTNAAKTTAESLSKLHERLAVVDAAQNRMQELSSSMVKLNDVLANKQARGAFGQGRMEAIVADGLHKNAYEFQHTLSNGKRPDCVIFLPGDARPLAIDAKFPLEAITAFREAPTDDVRKGALARLKQDINKHVNDIAERYLVAGETQEIALMFVPSESVYAELHEVCDDVLQKAFRSRVILVSPSLLMLAIQVVQAIVRDAQMRDAAEKIQVEVGKLVEDVSRLRDRAVKLQTHFAQASEDVGQVLISAEKVSKRGGRIQSLELDEDKAVTKDAGAPAAVPLQLKLGGRD
jgi:DNA recombination protein RmuC